MAVVLSKRASAALTLIDIKSRLNNLHDSYIKRYISKFLPCEIGLVATILLLARQRGSSPSWTPRCSNEIEFNRECRNNDVSYNTALVSTENDLSYCKYTFR